MERKKKSVSPLIDDILYVKRGNRYVHCSDPWCTNGLRAGHWHVWGREGSVTMRAPVWPDRMDLEAAMYECQEAMLEKIRTASKPQARTVAMSPLEKKAYQAYCEVLNSKEATPWHDPVLQLWGCSAQALVDAAFSALHPKPKKGE